MAVKCRPLFCGERGAKPVSKSLRIWLRGCVPDSEHFREHGNRQATPKIHSLNRYNAVGCGVCMLFFVCVQQLKTHAYTHHFVIGYFLLFGGSTKNIICACDEYAEYMLHVLLSVYIGCDLIVRVSLLSPRVSKSAYLQPLRCSIQDSLRDGHGRKKNADKTHTR